MIITHNRNIVIRLLEEEKKGLLHLGDSLESTFGIVALVRLVIIQDFFLGIFSTLLL